MSIFSANTLATVGQLGKFQFGTRGLPSA